MTTGALVRAGVVVGLLEAASDFDLNYQNDAIGSVAFVPYDPGAISVQIGWTWTQGGGFVNTNPASCTPLQLRLALTALGRRTAFDNFAANTATQAQKDWYNFSQNILRNDPVLLGIATQLGVSSATLDAIFVEAAKH